MPLKLHVLGGARLEAEGQPVAGRAAQRRRLAILVLLALAPRRTLARERLVAWLWPDSAPDAARRLLSESLYVIRRELGDDVVTSAGDEVTLGPRVACDVDDFIAALERPDGLEAAAAAYRGPFLDGWYVRDAPELERWSEQERTRLAGLHARTLRQLAELQEKTESWDAAARWWQQLVRLDPYSSPAVFHAARALAMSGERAAALQTLAAHEALLQEDLGVGLGDELLDLQRRIRSGEVAPRMRAPLVPSGARVTTPTAAVASAPPSSAPAGPPDAAPFNPGVANPSSPADAVTPPRRVRAGMNAAIAVLILALGAGAWAAARGRGAESSGTVAPAVDSVGSDVLDRRRVAVMYFEDRSRSRELAYLADGLTEYVIAELARLPGLRVLSPDAVRPLRDAPLDSVAERLGARTIVQARLEQSGSVLRVTGRIVDGRSLEQVGTLLVEAPVGETFALQDRISADLATELARWVGQSIRMGRASAAARVGARNDRALELVFRAEHLRREAEALRTRTGRDASAMREARVLLQRADSMLGAAEALDRSWALPTIERGWNALLAGRLENGTARVVTLAPGLGHAERAITLIESHGPLDSALMARALYLRGMLRVRSAIAVQTFRPESTMLRQGEEDLVRATRHDPALAGAWAGLALPRWTRGDFAGVGEAASRALAADAYLEESGDVLVWAWRAAYARGDLAEAERWCAEGRRRMPGNWQFVECELTIMRLDVAGLSGRRPDPERAWEIVRELERLDPPERARAAGHPYSPIFRRMLAAMVSAAAGDHARARATLAAARSETSGHAELSTDLLYETACLLFVLGERAEGERVLGAYLAARPDVRGFIERDRVVRKLRGIT